jgi:hypothetical protein
VAAGSPTRQPQSMIVTDVAVPSPAPCMSLRPRINVEMRDIGHSLDVLRRAIAARSLGVIYASRLILIMAYQLIYMPARIIYEVRWNTTTGWVDFWR